MTEVKKQFLAFNVGTNDKGEAYVFHLEGNVARVPVYRKGENGKKSFMSFAIGIGRNPWLALGEEVAKEQAKNTHCNEDTPFIEVVVFSPRADQLNEKLAKGSKVVLSGKPEKVSYKNKNDETVETVRIIADNIYPLSCKATPGGEPVNTVTHTVQVYKKQDGTEKQNNMITLLGGTIKAVNAVKEYNGTPVISFNLETVVEAMKMVAIAEGTYQKDADYGANKIVRCSVWGNRALNLGKVLVPGATLAVTGIPSKNTYNGNEYANMTVQAFSVLNWATAEEQAAANANNATNTAPSNEPMEIDNVDIGGDFESLLNDDTLPF